MVRPPRDEVSSTRGHTTLCDRLCQNEELLGVGEVSTPVPPRPQPVAGPFPDTFRRSRREGVLCNIPRHVLEILYFYDACKVRRRRLCSVRQSTPEGSLTPKRPHTTNTLCQVVTLLHLFRPSSTRLCVGLVSGVVTADDPFERNQTGGVGPEPTVPTSSTLEEGAPPGPTGVEASGYPFARRQAPVSRR